MRSSQADQKAYDHRHYLVKRLRGRAADHQCSACPDQAAEWAQLHTEDGEDPWADYVPLCRSCHTRYDQRGHRTPHTEASKRKMSEAHKAAYAAGRQPSRHNADVTECPKLHPYDEANTYHRPDGGRDCRTCMRDRTRASRARRAEAKLDRQ